MTAFLLPAPSASQARSSRTLPRRTSPQACIAASAIHCLLLELETWPKPGLVSHVDTGSHTDMDADTFRRSAIALRPYFAALVAAGMRNASMTVLRKIGLRAERAMLSVKLRVCQPKAAKNPKAPPSSPQAKVLASLCCREGRQ